jgi:hypothetical protein
LRALWEVLINVGVSYDSGSYDLFRSPISEIVIYVSLGIYLLNVTAVTSFQRKPAEIAFASFQDIG